MKERYLGLIAILAAITLPLKAQQKSTTYNNLVWFGDFLRIGIHPRWEVYMDCGVRRTEWLAGPSQLLVRPGITYALNKSVSFTAGLAYFLHYSGGARREELRGWQQAAVTKNIGRARISHRVRIEERLTGSTGQDMLAGKGTYTTRFRYQAGIQVPVNHKTLADKTVYVLVSDEVMMNAGKPVVYNSFDQNRFSAGLGYRFSEAFNIAVCYMNDYIHKNKAYSYENNNVIILNIYHNFAWKPQQSR